MTGKDNTVKHYYLHADLDAFFASVEQLDHPEYRGKPVIVGGLPTDKRSVVSTASYEARVFGVHSAMPTAKAYELCPQGIFLHGRMKRYSELSYQIMQIFADFSPDVQQMSIDEAFIDLTGTEKLFGPPQETAMKIKQRVKQETGLTVSIGLAPTKYLAKLASDMKKPDGFYLIEEGTEEQFMLNLPLKKVWGIGDKTYEALKAAGLRTTRDIHEKSLDALTFMYGNNTGNFLYNVVRGIETVTFEQKAKSHSISNETTFPFDLTDTYTAETAMLELCHSVIFRLLKENGFSRTVQVKIRYEDFSTVSIQQTYPQSVLTLDSLYTAAKELFEKKYEQGRGIRLLGIALENIEKTERSWQPGLFDDDNEKKQNVEKAILNLEKKHPEIKIHKARMLEKLGKGTKIFITVLCLFLTTGFFNTKAFAQENQKDQKNYEISGTLSGTMKGSVDTTFGMGNPFGISAAPPVFDTEVDLSALINITPNFYFQLEFLDKFNKNSYTLGYNGTGYLNLFKFSNRNITFPSEYSSNINGYGISGGKNEAPGIMLHFNDYENQKWKGDFLLRYDMTEQKTALFYGNNSVQDSVTQLNSYVHSNTFVIPSEAIFHISNVYVQSKYGDYKTQDNIILYKLKPQDYLIDSNKKLLVLSDSVFNIIDSKSVPYIFITFDKDSFCNLLLQDTGSYSESATFAGLVQTYFNTSDSNINLAEYSPLKYESLTKTINGTTGYLIQSPDFFLPYACANKYKISATEGEYLIKNTETQGTENSYRVYKQNDFTFLQTDFFDEKTEYAIVQNINIQSDSQNYLLPQLRYPFADKYPEVYLDSKYEAKLVFAERTITPVKQFDIGKNASAGSFRVYKNGVLLPAAVYDSNTGFVMLNDTVSELDTIYIVYEEESSDSSNGFVTTGAGFVYNILPSLTFDTSFTGKYQTAEKITDVSKNSYSAFTSGISYKNENLSVYDALTTGIETQKDIASSFVTKNEAGIKYETQNASAQAVSFQGIAVNTKTGKKSSDSINTNLNASYSLFNITAKADAAFSYIDLQTAGHSIKTQNKLFNFLDFSEIYRYSKNELEKADSISFSYKDYFSLTGQTDSKQTQANKKQNYLALLSSGFKTELTEQTATIKFQTQQQKEYSDFTQKEKQEDKNYFLSWYDISKNQFTGGFNSAVRNTSFYSQYKSAYNLLNLSPDLNFELSGKNLNTTQNEFQTTNILNLSIPFSTQSNAFAFNMSHKGLIKSQNKINKNYSDDINSIFADQKNLDFFYTSIPFYTLFDKNYKTKIQKASLSGAGVLEYDFTWRRKLFNDIKDLFIPLSATTGISRDVIHTPEQTTDTYQIKGKVSSSFINLFGSSSLINCFDWYRQEEYTSFVSAIFKFSPHSKAAPVFQISSGELLTFYIFDSNTLNINTDFYIDNYKNWSLKTASTWSRKTDKSLLLALTHLCWKNSVSLNLEPKVKDSFSITLTTQNKTHKEIYSYLRSSEITFLTHFNLTSAAGLSFGFEQGKTLRLGVNYNLGIKINY